MAEWVNIMLAFSHNYIKIKTKLQNNHHRESPEVQLNRSPITKDVYKKPLGKTAAGISGDHLKGPVHGLSQ